MMDSFQHTGAKKNVSLHLLRSEKDDDLIAAIDSEKFQIIISNLLSNAIEYSADGGKVEVSYSVGGDGCLQVSVLDHGVGIATEDQQRIFDRFVQLNTGTTRSHLGHGLGLSIAKALVDLMQGASAWSARPGECGYRWSGRAEAVFLHQRG
jgi:signal transduction histidine kinase